MTLASRVDMEFASLTLQLNEAWAERDQYLEQNVKLKAEIERLRAALKAIADEDDTNAEAAAYARAALSAPQPEKDAEI